MPKLSRPRHGSLQFYPRKRAVRLLPSVNWSPISTSKESVLGFITYKVGMASAIVKDISPDSMTKNKRKTIPVTVLEAPNMKIFSVRFYKNKNPVKDVLVSNDKELKKVLKVTKTIKKIENSGDYEDIRVLVHSLPSQTSIKKTPDLIELAINAENKFEFIKSLIGKEITIQDFVKDYTLFDTRGLTKGKGLQGPVKRFGITLKSHKSEKGVRKPGSLAPWHPARVTFRTPMAGQLGMFTRIIYNNPLIYFSSIKEKDINKKSGFKNYGNIKSSYIILAGSIQGPSKRQILITPSFRPTKFQSKKKFEFIQLT